MPVISVFDRCIAQLKEKGNPRLQLFLEKLKQQFIDEIGGVYYDEFIVDFLVDMFKPVKRIYFIKNNQENLDDAVLQTKKFPSLVLHKEKIYYFDIDIKSFAPLALSEKNKKMLIQYFKEEPYYVQANEIIKIEALLGIRTNKIMDFLNEWYWFQKNPIQVFRNEINLLMAEHIRELGEAIQDRNRRSDLGAFHLISPSDLNLPAFSERKEIVSPLIVSKAPDKSEDVPSPLSQVSSTLFSSESSPNNHSPVSKSPSKDEEPSEGKSSQKRI